MSEFPTMTAAQKQWIDGASLEALLSKWRFAPVGDPLLQGDTGEYFAATMKRKREESGAQAWTAASKDIGWEPHRE